MPTAIVPNTSVIRHFVQVPIAHLTSPEHAAQLAATIDMKAATPSASLPGPAAAQGGDDTTHFSVLDSDGNRVAGTLSINYPVRRLHDTARYRRGAE